jgi:hypothetical protein
MSHESRVCRRWSELGHRVPDSSTHANAKKSLPKVYNKRQQLRNAAQADQPQSDSMRPRSCRSRRRTPLLLASSFVHGAATLNHFLGVDRLAGLFVGLHTEEDGVITQGLG